MNDRQRRALTAISLLFVIVGAAFVISLAITVLKGNVRGDKEPARLFMLLIADWNTVAGAFKTLPALISLGLAGFGAYKIKDWLFYSIVGFSLLGFVATAYLLFEVTSVSTANEFWAYSPTDRLEDYSSFVAAARAALSVFCAWFIGVIAAELGVRIK